jgi:cell division protein FtsW (lipid II flippase)
VLGLQALVILGGTTRLIPLTGVTLPFISYGGSSLLVNFAIIGLLLRISTERPRV